MRNNMTLKSVEADVYSRCSTVFRLIRTISGQRVFSENFRWLWHLECLQSKIKRNTEDSLLLYPQKTWHCQQRSAGNHSAAQGHYTGERTVCVRRVRTKVISFLQVLSLHVIHAILSQKAFKTRGSRRRGLQMVCSRYSWRIIKISSRPLHAVRAGQCWVPETCHSPPWVYAPPFTRVSWAPEAWWQRLHQKENVEGHPIEVEELSLDANSTWGLRGCNM